MKVLQSRTALAALSRDDLIAWCQVHKLPAFRADQIRHWLFAKRAIDFHDMTDLPTDLRHRLKDEFDLFGSEIIAHQIARDRTEKLLLQLSDGEQVETVLMRETGRRTVCISTQVGCAMGCVFCASGMLGLKRNLSFGEILEQVLRVDRLLSETERLTNVVVMGIGEPLANLAQLNPVLEALCDPQGLGLSPRRITVSTVGLPDKMREFARLGRPYNLAVSLHAANDRLRDELVPVNDRIGIDAILAAAHHYFEQTGRRVSYEYVLLGGINDRVDHAQELAERLRGRNAHVNLIPMNDVEQLPFHHPSLPQTQRFVAVLEERGVNVTVRKRKGADIDAACGQLRLRAKGSGSIRNMSQTEPSNSKGGASSM